MDYGLHGGNAVTEINCILRRWLLRKVAQNGRCERIHHRRILVKSSLYFEFESEIQLLNRLFKKHANYVSRERRRAVENHQRVSNLYSKPTFIKNKWRIMLSSQNTNNTYVGKNVLDDVFAMRTNLYVRVSRWWCSTLRGLNNWNLTFVPKTATLTKYVMMSLKLYTALCTHFQRARRVV